MWPALLAGLGGFLGASLRYLVGQALVRWKGPAALPWGTLTVNVVGCFLIGALMGHLETRDDVSASWRVFLVVGVLGGFTTYSAFGFETLAYLRESRYAPALLHIGLHLALGLAAVAAGWALLRPPA